MLDNSHPKNFAVGFNHHHPQTRQLLQNWVSSDPDKKVREIANQQLAIEEIDAKWIAFVSNKRSP